MTLEERYELIKTLCQAKQPSDEVGELPSTEADLQDEFARLNTSIEQSNPAQDSEKWEANFVQELVFGS